MANKRRDLSGFSAVADSEPLYERLETAEGHLIEILEAIPGEVREDDGVWVRFTRSREAGIMRSTEVYLDRQTQQELGLALIANLKE